MTLWRRRDQSGLGDEPVEPVSPEYVGQALAAIDPRHPHRITTYGITVVDDDPHAALAAARPAPQSLGDTHRAPHTVPLGFHDELTAPRRAGEGAREFAQAIPGDWAGRLALTGTADQVRAHVQDLFASGVTTTVLSPVGPDHRSGLADPAKIL